MLKNIYIYIYNIIIGIIPRAYPIPGVSTWGEPKSIRTGFEVVLGPWALERLGCRGGTVAHLVSLACG